MTADSPTVSPVSGFEDVPVQDPPQAQHQQQGFSVDDEFSLKEDDADALAFDFSSRSFLADLQLSSALNTEDDRNDTQEPAQATPDNANESVSTLDIDAVTETVHPRQHTPPQHSSSSNSSNSEAQPHTPSDYSSPIDSQLTETTSTLGSPQYVMHDTEHYAYPVIIDASKTLPLHEGILSSPLRTMDSDDLSLSSDSKSTTDNAELTPQIGNFQPVESVNPTTPVATAHTRRPSTVSKNIRNSGPTMLQKVVSKTRPPHLPPKQQEEDQKHSKEWEEMMGRSRATGILRNVSTKLSQISPVVTPEKKRREEFEARRLARELSVEASTSLWQRAILPDWKKAVKDPELRKLWWAGIPTKHRSTMWAYAVGNALTLSKDSYSSSLARAKRLISTNRFPSQTLSQMEDDISSTLPQLQIFHHLTGPLYGDLRDLLCAWAVSRGDEGQGYVKGIARIGGMLLLNLTGPNQAFVVMRNLLDTGCLHAFYGGSEARDDVEAYYRIFDTLLADGMPKVYFNFKQYHISPSAYLPDWLLPIFLDHLPLEACSRIWDVVLLEGDAFLFRAALAMLACLESRLLFPDREELLSVLRGENSAATQVAQRVGVQSPIRDGFILGPKYDIYGINEEILWDRIAETEGWFKENTWRRLTQRELPDL